MGYDCTLHVVDEKMIRDQFIPKLLKKQRGKSQFDQENESAEWWNIVQQQLSELTLANSEGMPQAVARDVCNLAVMFSAAELPYHYERGFCLSLWPGQPDDDLRAQVPRKFIGNPEDLFSSLVKEYPQLHGQFPQEIMSNGCTGVYVAAEHVPELLKWVERKVARYPKPSRRLFRGLVLVLKEAASRKLAYWEATDLSVRAKTIMPPGDQRKTGLEEFRIPKYFAHDFKHRRGNLLVFSSIVYEHGDPATSFVNFESWPPRIELLHEYAVEVDSSRQGKWLMVAKDENADSYLGREVRLRDHPLSNDYSVLRIDELNPELLCGWAGFIGELVVARRESDNKHKPTGFPLVQSSKVLRYNESARILNPEIHKYSVGVVRLNDGSDILIWGLKGYQWRDGAFDPVYSLVDYCRSDFSFIPSGQSGFFIVQNGQLCEFQRSEKRKQHMNRFTNIMFLTPGPQNSIILKEGYNKLGDLGKLYFPGRDYYQRLEPELFDDEDPDAIYSLHWIESCDRFIAATPKRFWAIPTARVLHLPRYSASTGRKLRD
ncbi:MAG: hypothetical protein JNJ77_02635 [Planctomycetia bacterium]|nr:hypothetical protein [Planctomycetia bacterium]